MINLLDTKLFKLLHDTRSSEQLLDDEFFNFFSILRGWYSTEEELFHALKEIPKGLVSLSLLESKIKHFKPCKRKNAYRLHFISSLKLLLEYELDLVRYLFHNEKHIFSNKVHSIYEWTGKKLT